MRVRVSCDASAGSLRFLLRVPQDLELVADFVRHLHLRLPQKVTSLVLRVGGFALLPTLRLADVLRDDDEVCVTVAGSDERPAIQSSVPMAALPDSATAPVASAEKRRRVRDSRDSVAGKHADTPPKTQQLPPYPPVPPAAVAELAKKPKDAGNEDVEDVPTPPSKARKETKQSKPKGALVTSKQAAAEARQVLARSRQPSEEPQDEDMQQARSVNHPLLGELEVPPGQRTEEFVNRKLRTLKKAIRRQVEHYFGDTNWPKDTHLQSLADGDGFVTIDSIADFSLLKQLCTDLPTIRDSLETSKVVELSSCGERLRKCGLGPGWKRAEAALEVPKPAQGGYATEQPPAAQATTASGHDSGEDSAEESHGAEPSVTAERFDRDMDLQLAERFTVFVFSRRRHFVGDNQRGRQDSGDCFSASLT
ncbi:Larp1 [Symbiodinium sp. CCMP2592]|nr:Larp1 [Symbiodinium sp. CCMP2592]